MKKITFLYKNNQRYQVGEVTMADLTAVENKIPTKVSDLTNDSNYATEGYVDDAIGAIDKEVFIFADALPTEDIKTNKIYVIPTTGATETGNIYTEYLYKADTQTWEKIGEFKADQDLTNFYTKSETYNRTEIDTKIGNADSSEYLTQAQYDALAEKKANVNYYIYIETTD